MGTVDDLLDGFEAWWARSDLALLKAMDQRPEKISCYTCAHKEPGCCNQKVIVTVLEALVIVRFLRREGRDNTGLRQVLELAGELMEGTGREPFFHDAHPCVFLQDGRCSIYAVRPTACRSYYVITDPAQCQPGANEPIGSVNVGEYIGHSLKISMEAHRNLGLKENNQRILMGALPRLILLGLEIMESDDFQGLVRGQPWPNSDNLDDWIHDGKNVFQERLYQIRTPKKD